MAQLSKENEGLNFEFPLFTRKRLNEWRPPWEWPQQTFLERQIPVEITNESRHVAVKFQPIVFQSVSECQQIYSSLFLLHGDFFFPPLLSFQRGLMSGNTGSGFHRASSVRALISASGFLQLVKCLSISGPAGWSFSRPQQWGISLPLELNLLNSVCPAGSREWKAVGLCGWEGQGESNISTIIMFAFIKSNFIKKKQRF